MNRQQQRLWKLHFQGFSIWQWRDKKTRRRQIIIGMVGRCTVWIRSRLLGELAVVNTCYNPAGKPPQITQKTCWNKSKKCVEVPSLDANFQKDPKMNWLLLSESVEWRRAQDSSWLFGRPMQTVQMPRLLSSLLARKVPCSAIEAFICS